MELVLLLSSSSVVVFELSRKYAGGGVILTPHHLTLALRGKNWPIEQKWTLKGKTEHSRDKNYRALQSESNGNCARPGPVQGGTG